MKDLIKTLKLNAQIKDHDYGAIYMRNLNHQFKFKSTANAHELISSWALQKKSKVQIHLHYKIRYTKQFILVQNEMIQKFKSYVRLSVSLCCAS